MRPAGLASLMLSAALLAACGGHTETPGKRVDLRFTYLSSNLISCNCRHGCGPGLDGSVKFQVLNIGASSTSFDVVSLRAAGPQSVTATHDNSGLLYNQPAFELVPGQSRDISLRLQPDTPSTFPAGAYDLQLTFSVDGREDSISLGTIALEFVTNPACG